MYNNPSVRKITFAGLMLALVLLFQFLEQFVPRVISDFFGYAKFNISLAFILVTCSEIGYIWGVLLLILRFVLGPLVAGEGFNNISIISHIILLTSGLITVPFFWLIITKKSKITNKKNFIFKIILSLIFSALIIALLNALIFTRWYFGAFLDSWVPLSFSETYKRYDSITSFYFWIPNYWIGQISVYFVFNLINLILILNFTLPLIKIAKILNINS